MPDKLASVHKLEVAADPHKAAPGETVKAFAAFCRYRDLYPTERAVAEIGSKKGTPRVPTTKLSDWSRKFDWVERAKVWDAGEAARKSDALRQYRAAEDARHLKVLTSQTKQLEVVIERNRKLLKASTASTMTAAEASKMHTEVIKAQRLVMGEATEITATQEPPPRDFSKLTVEERVELARINEKLTKG